MALVVGCIGISVTAANLFPDETLNAIKRLPAVYSWLFWEEPRPPAPSSVPGPPWLPYTDADSYAVLSAWKHHWTQKNVIVVRQEIKSDPFLSHIPDVSCLPSQYRVPYREAMRDFASRWPQHWILVNHFIPSQEFVIVSESQLPKHETQDGVPAYAAGYFAFSAVGFSSDRRRAVTYVVHRDGTYGDGRLLLMRKNQKDQWVVHDSGNRGWMT